MGIIYATSNNRVNISAECTATKDDILEGYTAITNDSENHAISGGILNKQGQLLSSTPSIDSTNKRLQLSIPAKGLYSTTSKVYAAFLSIASVIGLTAAKLAAGQSVLGIIGTYKGSGNANAGDVLSNKTFSTNSLNNATGTMPNIDAIDPAKSVSFSNGSIYARMSRGAHITNASSGYPEVSIAQSNIANTIGLTASKVPVNNTVLGVIGTYKGLGNAVTDDVLSGKNFSTSSLSNATGTMTNRGAVSASLDPGGRYTIPKGFHNGSGNIIAKTKNVKMMSDVAFMGFGVSSSERGPYTQSFTMPANGTVHYNGITASYAANGTAVCEIYKNGTIIDSRNINSSNNYVVRATMFDKSFSAAKGDIIKTVVSVASGSHMLSSIQAVIEYFT